MLKVLSPMVFVEEAQFPGNELYRYRWIIIFKGEKVAQGEWKQDRKGAVSEYSKFRTMLENRIFPEIIPGKYDPRVVGCIG